MIYRLLVVVVFFTVALGAQNNTSSPYSFFGIGVYDFQGTVENRSMGGLSIYSDSIRVNLQNPSGLSRFKLVNFSVAGSYHYNSLKSESESHIVSNTSINYITIGIPLNPKLGVSFGLMPKSSVGYHMASISGQTITINSGQGGTNRVFVGAGYQVLPELSLGVEASYNFGEIENSTIFTHDEVQYGSMEYTRSNLSGFSFNFGATYKKPISENLELVTAATYGLESTFNSENYRRLSSVLVASETLYAEIEGMDIDMPDSRLTMPARFSIGVGIGEPKKWFAGVEYFGKQKDNYINRTITLTNVETKSASGYRLGGYYIPDYRSFTNYFKKITYRAGMRYEDVGLLLKGQNINEFGISFGVGLPVGRMFSNINIGVEYGSRGTTNAGLVKETFFNTFIGLTLNDKWFVKTLYD